MKKYLLDTDICIFLLKGQFDLNEKIKQVGAENCFISEITLAELKFGAENSTDPARHRAALDDFVKRFRIIPIFETLDFFAIEKVRLRKKGTPIDEFDLLIGSAAVFHGYILVTHNVAHLSRITNIEIEDWTQS